MKRTAAALWTIAALGAGAANAEGYAFDSKTLDISGIRIGNPLDVSTWWSGHGKMAEMAPLEVNPADPDFWMAFIDPKRHGHAHMTLMNPAVMAQFMEIETYTDMLDLAVWAKWFDLDSYAVLLDLQTYAYWMQPGAYAHVFDLGQFEPMLEVDNYTVVLTTAFDTFGMDAWIDAGADLVAAITE